MQQVYIDIYCERVGPEFWAEPFNAVTNLAFIISAILLTRLLTRAEIAVGRDPGLWALVALVYLIGIGSALFHTYAAVWAALMDTVPIALFILLYAYLAFRRFVGLGLWISLGGVAVIVALSAALPILTGFGGGTYLVAALFMIGIGLFLRYRRRHPAGDALLIAAGVFVVSLSLRTVDEPLCGIWPTGTHFLWHLLNAVVLYLVTRAMIRYGQKNA